MKLYNTKTGQVGDMDHRRFEKLKQAGDSEVADLVPLLESDKPEFLFTTEIVVEGDVAREAYTRDTKSESKAAKVKADSAELESFKESPDDDILLSLVKQVKKLRNDVDKLLKK